jgi:hypothetical protein
MFFLLSIYIISPDTIANPSDEIILFFEERISLENLSVFLDGELIKGEITEDYFYYAPPIPYKNGTHNLYILYDSDTIIFKFRVLDTITNENYNTFSFSIGFLYNSNVDTTFYPLYKEGKFLIFNTDFDIYLSKINISGNLIRDPDYYYSFYGYLNINGKFFKTEMGIINPLLEENILYSLTGLGFLHSFIFKNSFITPIFLYSYEKDTLITDYKRLIYGIRCNVESLFTFTFIKGYDDTTKIEGFPVFFPQEASVISGIISIKRTFTPYLNISYSSGSFNTFDTVKSKGFSYEFGIKNKNINIYFRKTDSTFIPIGNPFLQYGNSLNFETNFNFKMIEISLDLNLTPDFNNLTSNDYSGASNISLGITPLRIGLSSTFNRNKMYNTKYYSLSPNIMFSKGLFSTSFNFTYSVRDTNNTFSFSTNSTFTSGIFYTNLNLQYSSNVYNIFMSNLLDFYGIGLNIETGVYYEDGKHQESYRFQISKYF